MSNFKDWALQYVLSDDETAQSEIAKKAAKEIENTRASSASVGSWAASIQPWITITKQDDDNSDDDDDDSGSGDIIARAKALGFLADTLEALDKSLLRPEQVIRLVGFFGAMFSYDHKAGITASAKALRQLYAMKGFKPAVGVKMIEDVCKLKEDFKLQTAATRLEIYELFLSLVQDQSVTNELQDKYGTSSGFIVDIIQLCQNERDPRNLMLWFKLLPIFLTEYSTSDQVTEEIFKAFSAYFPITLRSSATPIGITADDLKNAVRACFASHYKVAKLAFPFLIGKLDQGDAITVSVKLDILKTVKACVEQYDNPQASVVPHVSKIWNSLKYEVRNGEVKDTIDATLEVLRAIANRLDGTKAQKFSVSLLKNYIDIVVDDCRDDLANPTYTKQAGLLLMTVITTNIRAFTLESAAFVDIIRKNLRQPKSPSHTKDLLLLLNSTLKSRADLFKNRKQGNSEDEELFKTESKDHLVALYHDVYLPTWTSKSEETTSEVLKQVVQGLALLATQQTLRPDGQISLLASRSVCFEVCSLLIHTLTKGLALSQNDNSSDAAVEDEAVLALQSVVATYTDGYAELVDRAKVEIEKRDWTSPSKYTLNALQDILSRLAFIGCSRIPLNIALDDEPPKVFKPLQHFIKLAASMQDLFPLSPLPTSEKESLANSYVISALHGAMLHFRDACFEKFEPKVLEAYSGSDRNWLEEFQGLSKNWLHQLQGEDGSSEVVIKEDDPEVYREFLRISLFIVRHLYREAAHGKQAPWTERVFAQVANLAALVVRSLDENLQKSCNLAQNAFNFFFSEDLSSSGPSSVAPFRKLLILGILQGLRPAAMAELYAPQGIAETFMCDTSRMATVLLAVGEIRGTICAVLANKYKGGQSTFDPESETMKRVLSFWGEQLKTATNTDDTDPAIFEVYNTVTMHTLAGACARQDKNVLSLVPILHEAIASPGPNGAIVARTIGGLVKTNELLTSENHAVVKRFYKQWTYTHFAKPLYDLALPTGDEDTAFAAGRYTTAILSLVSNCPFEVYQEDLPALVRLLITALNNNSSASSGGDITQPQVATSLEVLVEILSHEPEALKEHLKAIITAGMKTYEEAAKNTNKVLARNLAAARKLTLQLLRAIPKKFEERHLLPYALPMQRMLAMASGDKSREARKVALLARENWAKVSA
ncbi:Dos2-interacting transcription regulator of RNA-Pol-II-domain-containing protein [Pseudoneurospora amorphoporcata]|uniref:MMS19 nucleotide excision repair protein n=1 Tax=Pseudoneurospora amorphoporcata TaxID=241081 RepID=A0AAN6NQS9_9PEZI|nr:Dos2-interacting transcription regulator of RNA-Pol-II-domain-containing protein [Pseudoneurospora amorphoporcata]